MAQVNNVLKCGSGASYVPTSVASNQAAPGRVTPLYQHASERIFTSKTKNNNNNKKYIKKHRCYCMKKKDFDHAVS